MGSERSTYEDLARRQRNGELKEAEHRPEYRRHGCPHLRFALLILAICSEFVWLAGFLFWTGATQKKNKTSSLTELLCPKMRLQHAAAHSPTMDVLYSKQGGTGGV
ncbi:hypothetical protein CB0940_10547 [Cercospora beticola]|uniref:Uncharacterized protein n=1 Tax=Cercospora beticola TaxID=122368 RepID=A0A2G5HUT1_CERBT|nr:hypothetical protein CB0940_10547 [Cercospora beticola]PIA96278.1 hypothetical protein CB0940_10547 [Cercospora beticola]CAK1367240.1 unnamed protein product [Cercospora beticola]